MVAFGPVPSRRLGQSLGINNIPPKICSYACIYCQIGKTKNMRIEREDFYTTGKIVSEVRKTVNVLKSKGEKIDYLTFVPDGEPTLDINLGEEIERLRDLNIKIAVISNASLIWREDVQENLKKADWVSLKVDAISTSVWKKINRPHKKLKHEDILKGIQTFSREYKGDFVTETMLVKDFNDTEEETEKISDFLKKLKVKICYMGVPTRPPAEKKVKIPDEEKITKIYHLFKSKKIPVELITGSGGITFGFTGDVEKDILNITSVHPMRKDQVENLLRKADATWDIVKNLVEKDKIKEIEYEENKYYLRKLK
jgi:wyosine [tRNA(Phe)-imidazoG37] synthetase (radical SAM superfamily)